MHPQGTAVVLSFSVTPLASVPKIGILSHSRRSLPRLIFRYNYMCETGSEQLIELVSDLATHFGHEGPTHDIPGTRYIQTSHSKRMREVKHSKRPDSCARGRTQ